MLHSVLLILAVITGIAAVVFGIGMAIGIKTRVPWRTLKDRVLVTLLLLSMAGSAWAGWFGTAAAQDPQDDPGEEPLVATVASTEEEDEPLNAVNLTQRQIDEFLQNYSLQFDDRSLVSRAQDRLELIKGYGLNFQGSVYIPISKVLDKLDDINSGKLSGDELDALYKEVRHDIYQSIIADPVVLDMWLQLLSSLSNATENNGWVTEYMQEFDEAFARTDDPQGLDLFLEYAGKDIMVTRHCAEMAVHVCYILEQMDIKGITRRTSSANWELPIIDEETGNILNDEDSRTRTRESKTQEAELALLFTFVNKGGREVLAFGVNLYDQRAEIYPVNTTEPKVTTPTNTPNTTPTEPEPELPPKQEVKSYNLTIKYLETGTEKVMFEQYGPKSYKQGASYSVKSPQKEGYTCSLPTVAGTMPGQNQTITVWYTPKPQEKTNEHILQVQYYLEDGVTPAPGITWVSAVLKTGDSYSYTSPKLEGYTPDRAVVSGTMPDHDQVEKVIYKINSHNLLIHYVDKNTGKTLANDYSKNYKYQEYYEVESPTIRGYICETPWVYGYMPDRDVEVTVYYVKEAVYELRIHYVEKGTNKTLADDYADDYKEGVTYSVKSPEIKGYVCETPVVSGKMPARDLEITVYYVRETSKHTLTIYYEYAGGGRAAPTYRAELTEGESYSVTSPTVPGWTAVTSVVQGTMGKEDLTFTVYYTRDGNGTTKDPIADPGNQGNAPEKGGDNDTSQGEGGSTGVDQGTKPPDHDYGNGDQSTGQDRDDLDQDGNSTIPNVPGQGDDESSGTGGVDHPQEDGEGGNTEGGDIADKDPIPEHNGNDGAGSNNGNGGDDGWNDEVIGEPPV